MMNVVAGAKQLTCEEGEPKMVFEIERVPKEESTMAFKSLGFTTAVSQFFNFLNDWGIAEAPAGINTIDNKTFSNDEAIRCEEALQA